MTKDENIQDVLDEMVAQATKLIFEDQDEKLCWRPPSFL
jgi:hypothetical protein